MNDKQKEAAERALQKLELEESQRRIALRRRVACIEDVSFFLLPFRILYSLKQSPDQIPLNHFYPFRMCSADTEERIRQALQKERERVGEVSEKRLDEIRTSLESVDYTPPERREYYFSCFLSGWTFSDFKNWDWTGNRITEAEAARLQRYYTERQGAYEDHPERFASPALKTDDNMGRYSPEMQKLLIMYDNLP